MRYQCQILFETPEPEKMFEILQHEQESRERTILSLKAEKNRLTFKISASDTIALKTEFNRVLKALTVIEKVETL